MKTGFFVCSYILILILILPGCGGNSSGRAQIDYPNIQAGWTAYVSNPVINAGDALTGAEWNDPCVIKEGAAYIMYLTANQEGPGVNVVPFRATSSDGLTWIINTTPLLSKGSDPADFDYAKVETPTVVFYGSEYHMYYTGVQTDFTGPIHIGHATSPDGIVWTKDPANPVISPTLDQNDWNGWHLGEPGVVLFGSEIYVYFSAVGLRGAAGPTVKRTIGLAASADGYTFGAQTMVLEQGPLYPPDKNYEGYSTPAALDMGGTLHLFYDVVRIISSENPDWIQFALHHASSSDGIVWVEDALPIYTRISNAWTSREIRSPSVIQDNGKLKMWFAGDDYFGSGIFAIGYADADDTIY